MSFTLITVTHPVKLPPPFRAILLPGKEHRFEGDWRGYFRNTSERRLLSLGIVKMRYHEDELSEVAKAVEEPVAETTILPSESLEAFNEILEDEGEPNEALKAAAEATQDDHISIPGEEPSAEVEPELIPTATDAPQTEAVTLALEEPLTVSATEPTEETEVQKVAVEPITPVEEEEQPRARKRRRRDPDSGELMPLDP